MKRYRGTIVQCRISPRLNQHCSKYEGRILHYADLLFILCKQGVMVHTCTWFYCIPFCQLAATWGKILVRELV